MKNKDDCIEMLSRIVAAMGGIIALTDHKSTLVAATLAMDHLVNLFPLMGDTEQERDELCDMVEKAVAKANDDILTAMGGAIILGERDAPPLGKPAKDTLAADRIMAEAISKAKGQT